MRLSKTDREAMERAIALVRAESRQESERVDEMVAKEGWKRAARYCCYARQDIALHLKPWMTPPCWLRTDDDVAAALAQPYGVDGKRAAGELVQRLLVNGLSRYEPDPLRALEQAERPRRDERVVAGDIGKPDHAQTPSSQPETQ
jgi:Arc/MetJ family transcription regulator